MRSIRRPIALLALIAALAASLALAADGPDALGFDSTQLEESLFSALRGSYQAPDIPAAVRALDDAHKVAAVNTLGAFAKAFVASDAFGERYAEARKASKPKRGFGLPKINLDAKAIAKQAVTKAADQAAGKQPPAWELDKDPRAQLKRRLQAFLDVTADVDYSAKTEGQGSYRRFVDEAYEAKPSEWKMCFRAGKATGEAVRAFATEWIAEL